MALTATALTASQLSGHADRDHRSATSPGAIRRAQGRGRINQRGFDRGHHARQARGQAERQRRHRERRGIMRLHGVEHARDQSGRGPRTKQANNQPRHQVWP
jgi:hypothetical protein